MFESRVLTKISRTSRDIASSAKPALLGVVNRKTLAIVERRCSDSAKFVGDVVKFTAIGVSPFVALASAIAIGIGTANTLADRDSNIKAKIEIARNALDKRGVDKTDLAAFQYSPWKAPLGGNQRTLANMEHLDSPCAPKSRAEDSMSYVNALPYLTPTQVSKQVDFFWR